MIIYVVLLTLDFYNCLGYVWFVFGIAFCSAWDQTQSLTYTGKILHQ